jgi:predicted TIM-barrel fold metal-dependent hydrolase
MALPERFIALEEHWVDPELKAVLDELSIPSIVSSQQSWTDHLLESADQRIAAMDELGIDVQVLSHRTPGAQLADAERAVKVARRANDAMAAVIDRHPTRLAGFATVPLSDPEAAGRELRRCVEKLGFKGVLTNGRVGGEFLDHPELDPILRSAAELEVPLFMHPGDPSELITKSYYGNLQAPEEIAPALQVAFANAAWGWHVEAGTHALRMILSGVFDRYPELQIILGHWGELVPFFIHRVDSVTKRATEHLKRSATDYLIENFYVTPSGLETTHQLLLALSVMGADRIMYATDYPFVPETRGRAYIDEAPISDADKAKIAHRNAERLLRLGSG